jgi:catechol 2,3-dioxygenase-like lactoylglutathione lyase family enzyme
MHWLRNMAFFAAGIFVGTILVQSSAAQQGGKTGHRINHVGISVKNYEESLNFYTKVMGFKEAYRFPSPDGKPSTTFLQIDQNTFIEMAPPNPNQAPGLTHIGLYSDNANTTVAQLKQAGAMVTDARPSANSGSILANVTDPNGIRLEINEQPAGSLMRKAMEGWR